MTIRSKNPGENSLEELLPLLGSRDRLVQAEVDLVRRVDPPLAVDARSRSSAVAPSTASMVFDRVLSFAIAALKGRKSLTIVWSMRTLRSAR